MRNISSRGTSLQPGLGLLLLLCACGASTPTTGTGTGTGSGSSGSAPTLVASLSSATIGGDCPATAGTTATAASADMPSSSYAPAAGKRAPAQPGSDPLGDMAMQEPVSCDASGIQLQLEISGGLPATVHITSIAAIGRNTPNTQGAATSAPPPIDDVEMTLST